MISGMDQNRDYEFHEPHERFEILSLIAICLMIKTFVSFEYFVVLILLAFFWFPRSAWEPSRREAASGRSASHPVLLRRGCGAWE
jgi:hypothetical protein